MRLETRIALAKKYLAEAKEKPDENKLYIEDLEIAIPMLEQQLSRGIGVYEGFSE